MTLLDIGCGWGDTMKRAVEKYDVNVIGLTLSKNQHARAKGLLDSIDTDRSREVFLHGWEDFHQPVDRIVSIEAFEHFGFENYDDYFKRCFNIMPDDGRMTVQSSVGYHPSICTPAARSSPSRPHGSSNSSSPKFFPAVEFPPPR